MIERVGHRYKDVDSGQTLDVWFPKNSQSFSRDCSARRLGIIASDVVKVEVSDLMKAPRDVEEVYLRLHLLSECKVKPNELNLDGAFSLLSNVAWTSAGPVLPLDIERLRGLSQSECPSLVVLSVDKIPRMVDYVVPDGVRIADADRVRLGAHLAPGTTVMHEGFVNFNAGTLGKSMVEGRISQGVTVGEGSDIGGGASIMGTLSGGGNHVISIGKRCLLGANSGLGISLGDDCIVEAGLYLTAGTKTKLGDGTIKNALVLSGCSKLLFRRHSQSGEVEAIPREHSDTYALKDIYHIN